MVTPLGDIRSKKYLGRTRVRVNFLRAAEINLLLKCKKVVGDILSEIDFICFCFFFLFFFCFCFCFFRF